MKPENEELKSMSLGDHLEELRFRLIMALIGTFVGLIACLFFGTFLMNLIAAPYQYAMVRLGLEPELQAIELPEKFVVYFKTCLVFGLVVAAPWISFQAWAFVSAGLYSNEKKYIYFVAPVSAILFITGVVFFVTVIAPLSMMFLVKFNTGIEFITVKPTLKSYINYMLNLTLVFGLAFQMPIAIVFAEKMGLVTIKQLTGARKFVILALVFLSAVITPPDVISQVLLALPLYILFEGSILVCWVLRKRKNISS